MTAEVKATATTAATTATGAVETPPLPKIAPHEFRQYNRMADMMEYYHTNFRRTWNQLYGAVSQPPTTKMTSAALIRLAQGFVSHLTVHHDIEEQHIFPILAQRMEGFRPNSAPLQQHKQIHAGLDKLEAYLVDCKNGDRDLMRDEVKDILDGFGTVLWAHLDDEVRELGAENMRKYWSKEEIARLPM